MKAMNLMRCKFKWEKVIKELVFELIKQQPKPKKPMQSRRENHHPRVQRTISSVVPITTSKKHISIQRGVGNFSTKSNMAENSKQITVSLHIDSYTSIEQSQITILDWQINCIQYTDSYTKQVYSKWKHNL